MRVIRLYTPQDLASGDEVTLDAVAANHLVRVLRARTGDALVLFNGAGSDWQCRLLEADKRRALIRVECEIDSVPESPLRSVLGLCLSKGERFDWAIQKATEMGIAHIQPLYSERVDYKVPQDRLEKRLQHWQQIVISACEQCGRSTVPQVAAPQSLEAWTEQVEADRKFVLHCVNASATATDPRPRSIALLIGPEGGLTEGEVTHAQEHGFEALTLGPRILRTETAPAVALAILGARWGDLWAANSQNARG